MNHPSIPFFSIAFICYSTMNPALHYLVRRISSVHVVRHNCCSYSQAIRWPLISTIQNLTVPFIVETCTVFIASFTIFVCSTVYKVTYLQRLRCNVAKPKRSFWEPFNNYSRIECSHVYYSSPSVLSFSMAVQSELPKPISVARNSNAKAVYSVRPSHRILPIFFIQLNKDVRKFCTGEKLCFFSLQ